MSERPENQFEVDIRIAEARVNRCQKALDEAITLSDSAQKCINLCRAWSILAEKQRVYILNLKADLNKAALPWLMTDPTADDEESYLGESTLSKLPKLRFTDSLLDDMFGEGHPDDYGDK